MEIIRIGCAAALCVGAVAGQERPVPIADVAGLREVGARVPVVLGLHAPGLALVEVVTQAGELLAAPHRRRLTAWLAEGNDDQGFDLRDPAGWRAVGLDPAGDFSFAFDEPGGFLGLPQAMTGVIALDDVGRFDAHVEAQVRRHLEGAVIQRAESPQIAWLDGVAWSMFGKRALVYAREGISEQALRDRLAQRITEFGSVESVGARVPYRAVRSRLAKAARAAIYLRPSAWSSNGDGEDYESVVAVHDDGVLAAVTLPDAIAATLTPAKAVDVATGLALLPEPDAALFLRSTDPVKTLRAIYAAAAPARGTWEPIRAFLPVDGEVSAIGVATWFPQRGSVAEPKWLVLIVARDEETAHALVTRDIRMLQKRGDEDPAVEEGPRRLTSPAGTDSWWIDPEAASGGFRLARVGATVFIGDAVDQIGSALRGETQHDTVLGGSDVIEGYVRLDAIARFAPEGAFEAAAFLGRLHLRGAMDRSLAIMSLQREGPARHASLLAECLALGWGLGAD